MMPHGLLSIDRSIDRWLPRLEWSFAAKWQLQWQYQCQCQCQCHLSSTIRGVLLFIRSVRRRKFLLLSRLISSTPRLAQWTTAAVHVKQQRDAMRSTLPRGARRRTSWRLAIESVRRPVAIGGRRGFLVDVRFFLRRSTQMLLPSCHAGCCVPSLGLDACARLGFLASSPGQEAKPGQAQTGRDVVVDAADSGS